MGRILTDDAAAAIAAENGPLPDLLAEMTAYGRERDFPIVGPDGGRFLRTLAALAGARRVFEFGSGFGYSAAWFAGALPADGDLVLTDYDADNLATAEAFLDRSDYAGAAHYEAGDAMESFAAHDGPWDVVLIDHDKTRYADALELARPALADGAVVVADNVLRGPASADEIRAALAGDEPASEHAAGLAAYVEAVRDDDAFETSVVPLGSGLAVSAYRP